MNTDCPQATPGFYLAAIKSTSWKWPGDEVNNTVHKEQKDSSTIWQMNWC